MINDFVDRTVQACYLSTPMSKSFLRNDIIGIRQLSAIGRRTYGLEGLPVPTIGDTLGHRYFADATARHIALRERLFRLRIYLEHQKHQLQRRREWRASARFLAKPMTTQFLFLMRDREAAIEIEKIQTRIEAISAFLQKH